jgi:DNA processing protein
MNELFYKLLILRTPGIGAVKYSQLIARFGSPWAAAESLMSDSNLIDSVKREMDLSESFGIEYICEDDAAYPQNLRDVKNHPPVICARGNIATMAKPMVAMVGTRHATGAGLRFMSELAAAFASHGFAVVSGMAMGTDTAAHQGALSVAGDSQTVAVLAGGAEYIWPLENERLYNNILERGAIFSEMPTGVKPIASNFIQRNRWVAGLCEKLILGEADLKSGSMTTTGFALDYGRDVFAIPGHPSDQRSFGPNRMIKEGKAILCNGSEDFFSKAEKRAQSTDNRAHVTEEQNDVLDKLGTVPISESVLTELVKKSAIEIKRELVMLELGGIIKKTDMGYVKL